MRWFYELIYNCFKMIVRDDTVSTGYTLRFPFQFGTGTKYPNLDKPPKKSIGKLSFSLNRQNYFYVLDVKGFNSEALAKDYLSRLWAGVAWVSLNNCIPFSAETIFGTITYAKDPKITSENLGASIKGVRAGFASGDQEPIVYPSDKKIETMSLNASASPSSLLSFDDMYPFLVQGIDAPKSPEIILNAKLKTAIELYNTHYYENSTSTKFLTLIMALEVLATGKHKSIVTLKLLNKWNVELKEEKSKLQNYEEDYESLEALERELFFRKGNSLRSQIRSLVSETLEAENNPKAQDLAKQAVKLYDKRSTLVHEGKLPPDVLYNAENDTKQIVEMVLKAKFRIVSNMII